jgi:hypothetical protein
MGVHENLTGAQRAARYRAAKRAQGLRLKQVWVPDLRDPKVLAGIKREIAEINASKEEAEYNRWLDRNYDELMAEEPPYDWGGKEPQ